MFAKSYSRTTHVYLVAYKALKFINSFNTRPEQATSPAQKLAPSLSTMAALVFSNTSAGGGVASILTTRPCFS